MKIGTLSLACLASAGAVTAASAHHSPSAFDLATEVTISGTIIELEWKNPHIYFTIQTMDENGQPLLQQVEAQPISSLQTFGVTKEVLAPGSTIILRANPSRRGLAGRLRGLDVTTSGGVIYPLVLSGRSSAPPTAEQATEGLAGRWAVSPATLRSAALEMAAWPLTEAARTALAEVRAGATESQAGCPSYPPPMLDDSVWCLAAHARATQQQLRPKLGPRAAAADR